jgi:hypothetical protein
MPKRVFLIFKTLGISAMLLVAAAFFAACARRDEPELIFNEAHGQFGVGGWMVPEDYIQTGISTEEAAAVFHAFDSDFSAVATFNTNGELWNLLALEATYIMDDEFGLIPSWGVIIVIGEGALQVSFSSMQEPVPSDIHGVQVWAYVIHAGVWLEHEFRADFVLNDIPYKVVFSGSDLEEGKQVINDTVNNLILNPVNLAVLRP